MGSSERSSSGLLRALGFWATTSLVIGSVIGSGIFKKPALMASQLCSPELLIAIWVAAGLLTLAGALTNAEIAGMISETGGQYVFFRKMYGDFVAYLYGWAVFAVIQTGSIASITYVFSEYSEFFFTLPRLPADVEQSVVLNVPFIGAITPLANIGVKGLTMLVVAGLTTVNYLGVRFGGGVQVLFTSLKVAAIMALVAAGFALFDGSAAHFVQDSPAGVPRGAALLPAIFLALSGAFWAYDGWNNITYVAGEVRDPQRNIPRALFVGTLVVIAVYVVVNLAYLWVLPIDGMAASKLVASDVAQAVLGPMGGAFIAAAVMISTFGTSNGTILASARCHFALAQSGRFFRPVGNVHPLFRTPATSLAWQAGWTCVLVLTGTFDTLTDTLIFVSWVFYAAGALGVFVLRRKMPDAHRPYRVWGYPYVPALFVAVATLYVGVTLYNDVAAYVAGEIPFVTSVFGLALVAAGVPLYFCFRLSAARRA